MSEGLSSFLTPLDGAILVAVILAVTWLALLLRCRSDSDREFWLPDRMPWPAVAMSLARSEFGALVWVAVPGVVLTREGDLSYLSWAGGALLGRWIVNRRIVDAVFARREAGPLGLLEERLPNGIRELSRVLVSIFVVGGTIVAGFLALAPFASLLPLPFPLVVCGVAAIAVLWVTAGGVRSMVWADVVCFGLVGTGLGWILFQSGSPFREDPSAAWMSLKSAEQFDLSVVNKLRVFDFDAAQGWRFTFWTAVLAAPFAQAACLGMDPRRTTRWIACRNPLAAKRAITASFVGQILILALLAAGCFLFLEYRENPPTDPVILGALDWRAGLPGRGDLALPVWMLTEPSAGLRGFLLAGLLLFAISECGNGLIGAAAIFRKTGSLRRVRTSVVIVAVFSAGMMISAASFLDDRNAADPVGITLMFTDYLAGPLLGLVLCALSHRSISRMGAVIGILSPLLVTAWLRADWMTGGTVQHPDFPLSEVGMTVWSWPLGVLLVVFFAPGFSRRGTRES